MEVVRAWAAGGFPEPPGSQPIPTKNPTRKTTQKMFFPKPLPVFMMNILGMFEHLVNQSGFRDGYKRNAGRIPIPASTHWHLRQRDTVHSPSRLPLATSGLLRSLCASLALRPGVSVRTGGIGHKGVFRIETPLTRESPDQEEGGKTGCLPSGGPARPYISLRKA